MLTYRYRIRHRPKPSKLVTIGARLSYNAIGDAFARRIRSPLTFCFVGGCGHSGTTLLATRLGAHPSAFSVPGETNVLTPLHGLLPARAVLLQWSDQARHMRKSVVVEKTPKHIHCFDRARHLVENTCFIAIHRNPLDTVASLYKRFNALDYSVERWLLDNRPIAERILPPGTHVVAFEDLVTDPDEVLARTWAFMGLDASAKTPPAERAILIDEAEERKTLRLRYKQVGEEIWKHFGNWSSVLSPKEASSVWDRTHSVAMKLGYSNMQGLP